jgi:hypothetical protein
MLDLCSIENQDAEAMQGLGKATQAPLNARQLITLHI